MAGKSAVSAVRSRGRTIAGMVSAGSERPGTRQDDGGGMGRLRVFSVEDSIEVADVDLTGVPELVRTAKRRDGFVWLCLVDPAEETVDAARETLEIHPVAA